MPRGARAEPLATAQAWLLFGGAVAAAGLEPLRLAGQFRTAPSILEPLSGLVASFSYLVPRPLALAVEGTARLSPQSVAAGWAVVLLALACCQWAASRLPAYLLVARAQRARGARTLGGIWDALWPLCRAPWAAVLLKDAVTAWRANLMMAPSLPVAVPVSLYLLHRLNPAELGLPPGALLAPVLILVATALGASLFEFAEGSRPPPMPYSPGRLAALKAVSAAVLTSLAGLAALFAAFPPQAAWGAAPGVAAAGLLLPVLLIELLAFEPGAAAEVFAPGGLRTAALWSAAAIGTAGFLGQGDAGARFSIAMGAAAAAWAMWGRDRLLAFDLGVRDQVVMVCFFGFVSRAMGLAVGLGAGLAPAWAKWAELAGTALLQVGLLLLAAEYLRRSAPGRELGLPAERPAARALAAGACGLAVAAAFASLGGESSAGPALALDFGAQAGARMLVASFLGPLAEECFFRGVVHRAFSARLGRVLGLAISAAVFACAHAGPPSATLFVLGLVLGVLYEWKGSVFEPAVAHMAFNHVQVLVGAFAGELGKAIAR